jgi:hypothetical protein
VFRNERPEHHLKRLFVTVSFFFLVCFLGLPQIVESCLSPLPPSVLPYLGWNLVSGICSVRSSSSEEEEEEEEEVLLRRDHRSVGWLGSWLVVSCEVHLSWLVKETGAEFKSLDGF